MSSNFGSRIRLATLNCSSLGSLENFNSFVLFLKRSSSCSILFLQETRLSASDWTRLEPDLPDWHITFVPAYVSNRGKDGGVAILLRKSVFPTFPELIWSDSLNSFPSFPGRVLRVSCSARGLSFDLCNLYFPSGNPPSQRSLIDCLSAAFLLSPASLDSPSSFLILGGDFNFVHNPSLDRSASDSTSDPVGLYFSSKLSSLSLVDVFRRDKPESKIFSFFSKAAGTHSRLDRFYISGQNIASCSSFFPSTSPPFTDHRPVFLDIPTPSPSATGPGLPRVRLHFLSHPSLVQSFDAWLQAQISLAPVCPNLFLLWWVGFKKRLRTISSRLNTESRRLHHSLFNSALPFPEADVRAVLQRYEAGDLSALDELSRILVLRSEQNILNSRFRMRHDFLKRGETPSRLFSHTFGSKRRTVIPSLFDSDGSLVTDGPALASVAISHFAQVSAAQGADIQDMVAPGTVGKDSTAPGVERVAAPGATNFESMENSAAQGAGGGPVNPPKTALEQVLDSVKHSSKCPPSALPSLSNTSVSVEEISRALSRMPSGRSPGPDGIPIELYRKFRTIFLPLLSRLFCTILSLQSTPHNFTLGVVTFLFKSGDPRRPENYRPITLLNSDYKLFAKILSNRIIKPLASVIGPEQSAFLPGRRLGDSVLLLQSLDTFLTRTKQPALLVACDFRKAYDTVSRPFLFSIMEACSFHSIVPYIRLLLTDTRAYGIVNGTVSPQAALFSAGVRQGCPLSPTLYLFVAHALSCFLFSQRLGITLPLASLTDTSFPLSTVPTRITSLQFADDTHVLLSSSRALPTFLCSMSTFEQASGQALHYAKTRLMQIGSLSTSILPSASPFTIVTSLQYLGTCFKATPDWPRFLEKALSRVKTIAGWNLSEFGRAHAVSSYVYSLFFFSSEFSSLPPKVSFLAPLEQSISKLLDRNCTDRASRLRLDFYCLPTSQGGFGLAPLLSSLLARHASWAVRFFLHPHLLWVRLWKTILVEIDPTSHIFSLLPCSPPSVRDFLLPQLPDPLKRCFTALYSILPPNCMPLNDISQLSPAYVKKFKVPAFEVSSASFSTPFVKNPWLSPLVTPETAQVAQLNSIVPCFSLQHLAQCSYLYPNFLNPPQRSSLPLQWNPPQGNFATKLLFYFLSKNPPGSEADIIHRRAFFQSSRNLIKANPLLQKIFSRSLSLLSTEHSSPAPLDLEGAFYSLLPYCPVDLPVLRFPVPLTRLSISKLTFIHFASTSGRTEDFENRIQIYFDLSFSQSLPAPLPASKPLIRSQFLLTWRRLVSIKWDNRVLSFYWRFVLRGIWSSDHHTGCKVHCICSQDPKPDRSRVHSFWLCPIAHSIRVALADHLRSAGVFTPFTQYHVWLLISPDRERLPPLIWSVLSIISIFAMEYGRSLVALVDLNKSSLTVPDICNRVRSRFQFLLADFGRFARIPGRQRASIAPDFYNRLFPRFNWNADDSNFDYLDEG